MCTVAGGGGWENKGMGWGKTPGAGVVGLAVLCSIFSVGSS